MSVHFSVRIVSKTKILLLKYFDSLWAIWKSFFGTISLLSNFFSEVFLQSSLAFYYSSPPSNFSVSYFCFNNWKQNNQTKSYSFFLLTESSRREQFTNPFFFLFWASVLFLLIFSILFLSPQQGTSFQTPFNVWLLWDLFEEHVKISG